MAHQQLRVRADGNMFPSNRFTRYLNPLFVEALNHLN